MNELERRNNKKFKFKCETIFYEKNLKKKIFWYNEWDVENYILMKLHIKIKYYLNIDQYYYY